MNDESLNYTWNMIAKSVLTSNSSITIGESVQKAVELEGTHELIAWKLLM